MVEHSKRKKFHDKDKYYRLAKEQGLRSRAAFKLTQINRKVPFLEKCSKSAVLDLCAAPGGWTQIARKTCPKHVAVIAVDILPIRAIPGVITLIGDITTDKCQADIRKALAGIGKVDAVLHDGAPNIGAEYGKDAYEQNELAVHALKCATQHLVPGGTFLTKVYRSRDYASFHWVMQQLFDSIQVIKPTASRSQSAEIFLIGTQYKAPAKIDPRLLDPKHIFAEVAGDSTGGAVAAVSANPTVAVSVFDKSWNKQRRHRGGYDMEHLDASMRHITPVKDFVVTSTNLKTAIQLLSSSTGFTFTCAECSSKEKDKSKEDACECQFLLHHPFTTAEIKACLADLQVLNQSDFKTLLNWRTKLQDALQARKEDDGDVEEAAGSDDEDEEEVTKKRGDDGEEDESENEEEIQKEIEEMRLRRQREKKRLKKKERAAAAKRRRKAAMDVMTLDVDEQDKVFSLATLKGDLNVATTDVNLDQMTDEQIFGAASDDEDGDDDERKKMIDDEDEEARLKRRELELEEAYQMYLQTTKNGEAKSGTKMAKRSKRVQREKLLDEVAEDEEMALAANPAYNARAYAELLQGPKDSDDDDDSTDEEEQDDDGYNANPMTPEEHAQLIKRRKETALKNPLIHTFADDEPTSLKTARWFSNPLFASIGKAAEVTSNNKKKQSNMDSDDDDNSVDQDEVAAGAPPKKKSKQGLSADEVLASMPKTDKQKRHEKRLKAMAREESRKARKAKRLGEEEEDFQLAPAARNNDDDDDDAKDDQDLSHLSESQKKRVLEARQLIKAGLGRAVDDHDCDRKGIEIVPADERPLPVMDDRNYNEEGYDSDDYAQALALGTMMLRKSKERALVDASYNRYAWNDPPDLPDWFADDESKHHRPQLPIPPALIAKMKEKMLALSVKPIKKVAEARARKTRLAKSKLAAAKKQAENVARNSSDMSEAMKLKAISKALRGHDSKKSGKQVVVAKKGRPGAYVPKGAKIVDKRIKKDTRALERKEKTRKKGKQNKLVGSKRRRHHS